jgi:hypothetical protein
MPRRVLHREIFGQFCGDIGANCGARKNMKENQCSNVFERDADEGMVNAPIAAPAEKIRPLQGKRGRFARPMARDALMN